MKKARLKRTTLKLSKYILIGSILLFLLSALFNKWVINSTEDQIYSSVNEIPFNEVGLVLGTNKQNRKNRTNPYFKYRMEAAAKLYHHNKINYILASGDNSTKNNDEPTDMKNYLIKLGVPSNRIILDYAGFRTFDSMVRAKEIFGQKKFTVISQKFHNQRAVFIGNKTGLETIAFNAKDIRMSKRMELREFLAKTKAVLDLYLLGTQPKFLGEKVLINLSQSNR